MWWAVRWMRTFARTGSLNTPSGTLPYSSTAPAADTSPDPSILRMGGGSFTSVRLRFRTATGGRPSGRRSETMSVPPFTTSVGMGVSSDGGLRLPAMLSPPSAPRATRSVGLVSSTLRISRWPWLSFSLSWNRTACGISANGSLSPRRVSVRSVTVRPPNSRISAAPR